MSALHTQNMHVFFYKCLFFKEFKGILMVSYYCSICSPIVFDVEYLLLSRVHFSSTLRGPSYAKTNTNNSYIKMTLMNRMATWYISEPVVHCQNAESANSCFTKSSPIAEHRSILAINYNGVVLRSGRLPLNGSS